MVIIIDAYFLFCFLLNSFPPGVPERELIVGVFFLFFNSREGILRKGCSGIGFMAVSHGRPDTKKSFLV
jgi:hypothetical protein